MVPAPQCRPMAEPRFQTPTGVAVPAVTAEEMRAVDRVAVEELGLGILQMMENAGRTLARQVRDLADGRVLVAAGSGGNGGGGLACARHLHNHGVPVGVVLDREPGELTGAAARQHRVLDAMDVETRVGAEGFDRAGGPAVVVDALVGYGLDGAARGTARELIESANRLDGAVVSLDVPSGVDATTGDVPGVAVEPDRTTTLALPKTGLADHADSLVLADIGIPGVVYRRLDLDYESPFGRDDRVELERAARGTD